MEGLVHALPRFLVEACTCFAKMLVDREARVCFAKVFGREARTCFDKVFGGGLYMLCQDVW